MARQRLQILLILSSLTLGKAIDCAQKNTSCSDIKTDAGFKFPHGGQPGSTIDVIDNKTMIAHAKLGIQFFKYSPEVMSMDNYSVITKHCRDLQVKCFIPDGRYIVERCVEYKITEEPMKPVSPTLWVPIISAVGAVAVIILMLTLCSWRKEISRKQGAATVLQLSFYLQRCMCLKRATSRPETARARIGLDEISSASDPAQSGENGIQQDDTLESVIVDSIDCTVDGKTPQTLSLDRNLSNGGIQPSKNEDISAPEVNGASDLRAMYRNVRDDPGGVTDNKGKDIPGNRKIYNGWTPGDRDPEGHVDEEQPLMNQGAAIQDSDMTGQAAVLVNRRSSDPDQVSRCPTAAETDVELAFNMKKYTQT